MWHASIRQPLGSSCLWTLWFSRLLGNTTSSSSSQQSANFLVVLSDLAYIWAVLVIFIKQKCRSFPHYFRTSEAFWGSDQLLCAVWTNLDTGQGHYLIMTFLMIFEIKIMTASPFYIQFYMWVVETGHYSLHELNDLSVWFMNSCLNLTSEAVSENIN